MNKRKCVFALVFLALTAECALAQQGAFVCFSSANAAQLATSHANCPTVVTPDPGSIGVFPVSQVFGASFSGTLTGDLGQIEAGTLSTPCTSQPFLQLTTIYSPGVHTLQAQFTGCDDVPGTFTGTLIVVVPPFTSPHGSNPPPPPPPCGVTMIDPISSTPKLWQGDHITTQQLDLANASPTVQGVAADGVTEALLRINTSDGANVTVNLTDGSSGSSTSPDEIGGLTTLDGGTPASSVTVTAHDAGAGPYAYVLYRAPLNFSRANMADDNAAIVREVHLETSCQDNDGTTSAETSVTIARPPVILVHGIWSSSKAWDQFNPVAGTNPDLWANMQADGFTWKVDYSTAILGITSTAPAYPSYVALLTDLQNISGNTLGFDFNAPIVLKQIQQDINAFKQSLNVAAVQADVVAHSMGGDIIRTMVTPSAISNFVTNDTYGFGPIHKLITITTPHQGTPIAIQLLPQGETDNNKCVRNFFAVAGLLSLQNVTTSSGAVLSGAVGDLRGDGAGGSLSPALAALISSQPFSTAYVAAVATQANLSGLDCTFCKSSVLSATCGSVGDPLATHLTSQGWSSLFAIPGLVDEIGSDALVPLASQLNQVSTSTPVTGAIHSSSLESLDFNGPSVLDSTSGVPDKIILLLNEPSNGPDFIQ